MFCWVIFKVSFGGKRKNDFDKKANAGNISFKNFLQWSININSIDKSRLADYMT